MNGRWLVTLAIAATLAACGHGAPQHHGAPPPVDAVYGQCAFCHDGVAEPMYATGGHGGFTVSCETCHNENLTPGRVGPDHRNVPVCVDCHTAEMTHMDPAAGTPQECLQCHTPHGSPNLYLINEAIGAARTTVPIDFFASSATVDGGFASASDPGTGLCEVCHDDVSLQQHRHRRAAPHHHLHRRCHLHSAAFAPPYEPRGVDRPSCLVSWIEIAVPARCAIGVSGKARRREYLGHVRGGATPPGTRRASRRNRYLGFTTPKWPTVGAGLQPARRMVPRRLKPCAYSGPGTEHGGSSGLVMTFDAMLSAGTSCRIRRAPGQGERCGNPLAADCRRC
ncbi:MAG: cytochrome c3 family protein [Candidatus Binatia bacterium]